MNAKEMKLKMYQEWKPQDWWKIFTKNVLWYAGFEIESARMATRTSQSKLASLVGTKQSGIARFERGNENISLKRLNKMANAMGYVLKIKVISFKDALREEFAEFREPIRVDFSSHDTATITQTFSLT